MDGWHPYEEEEPTAELRFNTWRSRTSPRLEQRWLCREGARRWEEWRPVPYVDEQTPPKEGA